VSLGPVTRQRRIPQVRSVLVAALFAVASVVSIQAPAAAAVTYKYISPRMYAEVTVTFPSKTRVKVAGFVEDRCPADGAGVYARLDALLKDGKTVSWGPIGQDNNGCNNGRKTIGNGKGGYLTDGRKVDNAYVVVCRRDADGGQQPHCVTKVWDNPKVAG
jgi:hypothetical protein